MNLLKGFIYGLIAQVITFLQLQGQLRYSILKNNTWFVVLLGLPISYLFMISVRYFVVAYDGQIWPSRLIGFGIGVVVFSLMSHWLFKEPFTLKTLICLGLGSLIVLILLLWK
jgi:hypothetical protein